jgi:uracil phosphoribosyltransferase
MSEVGYRVEDVTVVEHPLVARYLAVLRDRNTPSPVFRLTLADVSMMLLYEALRDLEVREEEVQTPLEPAEGLRLADEIVLIAILRAGLGMVEGALRVVPEARVGHLGMYRDEDSLTPVGYYENVPDGAASAEVVVVDPMLATGGSAVNALQRLKDAGAQRLRMVCLVAAPEGLAAVQHAHPGVPITCAAVDRQLDDRGYIRPGLGDAGDRIFGTE